MTGFETNLQASVYKTRAISMEEPACHEGAGISNPVADVFADVFHFASRVEKEGPGKEIGILWLAPCYESSDSYFKLP